MDDRTRQAYADVTRKAAEMCNAVEDARIPGLWNVPGYPELTTSQMIGVAFPGYTGGYKVSLNDPA